MDAHASPIMILCSSFFLMACCFNPIVCNALIPCIQQERDALLSLNNGLPAGSGVPSLSWEGLNCCQWHGVQCSNHTSHVINLHLSASAFWQARGEDWYSYYFNYWQTQRRDSLNLSSALLKLKYLEHLDLSFNGFTGVIPPGLSALTHLRHLDLSSNDLTGVIPGSLSALTNLRHLDLSWNYFNGISLNCKLGNLSKLQFLDLSLENMDVDMVRIANLEWISNLVSLNHLSLHGINLSLSGERFGKHISRLRHLQYLDVEYCGLSGSIPSAMRNLTSLTSLFLSNNMFSSQIPSWLGNMTALHSLCLNDNNLDGPFPMSLSRLPALQDLRMFGNPLLSGNLSRILNGEWPHLTKFFLYGCEVTGILPSSVGNISSLTSLSMYDMAIEGSIPSSIGNLSALEYLYIGSTSLNGMIPSSLGQLSSLRTLHLSYNQLSGMIPSSLGQLSSLTYLDLSNNQLSGGIPTFEAYKLETIFLKSNNLQGDVFLDSFENNTSLRRLFLSNNELTVKVNPLWIPKIYLFGLRLASCRIGGNLPAFLSTQYELDHLDLSDNNLVGSIPSWIEGLKDLSYLNLSYNHLEGHLPSSFNPTQYDVLDLHSNSLSGPPPIPHVESPRTCFLDLSYNRFTGVLPKNVGMILPEIRFFACSMNYLAGGIPTSIGLLQQLQVLDLAGNELNGSIPSSITNCSTLTILNLANNSLTGHIPSDIGSLWLLKSLHLNGNLLVGNLPQSLLNCSALQILDVGKNLMSGNIPLWIARFSEMMILILRENQFQGQIPPVMSNLSALRVLDVSHNKLVGFIPKELGKLVAMVREHAKISNGSERDYYYREQIQVTLKERELDISSSVLLLITCIDLSGNELSGKIPSELGNLKGLHVLNISKNNIGGEIPSTLGMVRQLESLDLSNNKLQGKIPFEMLNLSFLAVLNMSHNMLEGRIPVGGQFSTFSATSFCGNNELCGFPLNNTCGSTKASGVIPGEEDEDGEIPWHWYVEWMASCAVGFWGVVGVLHVKKDWRRGYFRALDKTVVRLDKKLGLSNLLWR